MTPAEIIQRQLEAYNRGDIDGFVAHYSADVVVGDGAGKEVCRGVKKLRELYGAMFRDNPHQFAVVTNRIALGEYVIDDEDIVGRADNVRRRAVVIYRLVDRLIVRVSLIRA